VLVYVVEFMNKQLRDAS